MIHAGPFAVSCPRAMEDVPVNPVNPVNQVSGSRETRCKTFMKQMAGDVFGEAFLDLYWPVNLLHCAIYICFGVSLSYSFGFRGSLRRSVASIAFLEVPLQTALSKWWASWSMCG